MKKRAFDDDEDDDVPKKRLRHGERDPLDEATRLMSYFARKVEQKNRDDDHLGLELASWWKGLLEDPQPDPVEIRRLLNSVQLRTSGLSPAWVDLIGGVENWAKPRLT